MSNSNGIFAIAEGTQTAAMSYDGGTTWDNYALPSNQYWRFISGITGKFLYNPYNVNTRYSTVVYAINDNVTWLSGTLPNPVMFNITAIADGEPNIYVSYNGYDFT